jgi:hypothetical protein
MTTKPKARIHTEWSMSCDVHPEHKQKLSFVVSEIITKMESSDCQCSHAIAPVQLYMYIYTCESVSVRESVRVRESARVRVRV